MNEKFRGYNRFPDYRCPEKGTLCTYNSTQCEIQRLKVQEAAAQAMVDWNRNDLAKSRQAFDASNPDHRKSHKRKRARISRFAAICTESTQQLLDIEPCENCSTECRGDE